MFKKITSSNFSIWLKITVATIIMSISNSVFADMPTVEENSTGTTAGFWAYITGWFRDIMVWLPLGLMSIVTLWVAWSLVSKVLNERNQDKPNWGGVFAHAAGCVLLLVVTVFLGNQAIEIWSTGTSA